MAAVITFDEVRARGARGKLLDLRTAIASAKDRNEVNVLLQQSRADGLTLSTSRRDEWFVETPFQIGARNWVLWIEYTGDSVRALRLRTADSLRQKPADAPDDLILR